MENKEIMNVEEIETEEEMEVTETETSGKSKLKKFVIGAAIVGIGAAIICKNRDKIEARRIAKLRKKGYVIIAPDEVAEAEAECDQTVEVEETEE